MKQIFCIFLFMIPLMSCNQLPVERLSTDSNPTSLWQERQENIGRVANWSLSGRFIITIGSKSDNASFFWNGSLVTKELKLFGPFGSSRLRLYEDSKGAVLQRSSGERLVGISGEALLYDLSGWLIPFNQMNYWVRGLPAPGKHGGVAIDVVGRALSFVQDGWEIQYNEYISIDGIDLPKSLSISLFPDQVSTPTINLSQDEPVDDIKLKLTIESWNLYDEPS